ncbi:hypothetical protein KV102_11965 [Mumia sp. zg.B53]|uniref:hypothetical protein n=1 Tax=unclassified Mumia TaxID=2621872 RepID=UPI001C6E20B6|nr:MULTISPECIES: hypothetical protein [unclassified Mumia]MBW9206721.1 hypothetical protein [Mumia sp. zg.B17]MBW9210992.1 hypothetical protein [Mumia sp. zg.B21]MBW9215557.1 hypothetical protein [Mumia sp. zg.B53]MDD9348605.1 hypothetical protein [Mumia sp.]
MGSIKNLGGADVCDVAAVATRTRYLGWLMPSFVAASPNADIHQSLGSARRSPDST